MIDEDDSDFSRPFIGEGAYKQITRLRAPSAALLQRNLSQPLPLCMKKQQESELSKAHILKPSQLYLRSYTFFLSLSGCFWKAQFKIVQE